MSDLETFDTGSEFQDALGSMQRKELDCCDASFIGDLSCKGNCIDVSDRMMLFVTTCDV